MKVSTSCALLALVAVVAAAPMEQDARVYEQQKKDFLRDKRSQYGVQYVSPCAAAAAAASLPAFGPPYHYDVAPVHGGYVVPHYGYGGPHYRSVDTSEEPELLAFSDMNHIMQEHMPMARYGAYGAAHAAGPMVVPAPAPAPAAYGVFPNAKSGGCNVPLLFSCSPSIVQGRIVQQPHQHMPSFGSSEDAYRGVLDSHGLIVDHEEAPDEHSTTSQEPSQITLHKA